VIELRRRHRWGADHIAHEVGLSSSTVQSILRQVGLARLDRGDRTTNEPRRPRRYQRDRPGELVHVDVKKLAAIPTGGGWRMHGRGAQHGTGRHSGAGYRYIHTAIDDRTRLAYGEILDDEQADTAAAFWTRAVLWFELHAITVERVITDNGACYRSRAWAASCTAAGVTHKRTRPYRPQTNGKIERFHRTLADGWAFGSMFLTESARRKALPAWLHEYNHHRPHTAIGGRPPITRLTNLSGQYI